MQINLLDLDEKELRDFVESLGEKSYRSRQLLSWLHKSYATDFEQMTNLNSSFLSKLREKSYLNLPEIINESISSDSTIKWLLKVDKKNIIETVFIPESKRGTLCISSQAGCIYNCSFCKTGKQGFNRNLSASEIISQLLLANKKLRTMPKNSRLSNESFGLVSNVVFMGMGEPLANYKNLIKSTKLMLDDNFYGLSRKKITVSTAGLVPGIKKLVLDCPVSLAISLHAPNDSLRDTLMPINIKYPLKELLNACQFYLTNYYMKGSESHKKRNFITFEYVMLDNINDSKNHAKELSDLLSSIPCKVNLIPFNSFANSTFKTSSFSKIFRFRDILLNKRIFTTIRKTRGDDIDGACGQLAGRIKDKVRRLKEN